MNSSARLKEIAEKLRVSANAYRKNADTQDREAIHVEILAELPEDEAATALTELMRVRPKWFPS